MITIQTKVWSKGTFMHVAQTTKAVNSDERQWWVANRIRRVIRREFELIAKEQKNGLFIDGASPAIGKAMLANFKKQRARRRTEL